MSAVAAAADCVPTPGRMPPAASSAPEQLRPLVASDFVAAMRRVGPSMARGSAMELDPVRWGAAGVFR